MRKQRIKLLVIDDQPSYRILIEEHAELCSFQYCIECEFAESTADVLRIMKNWGPSVVLVDAHMPDIDCFELIERWRGGATSIIVTSDKCSRDIEFSALARGADAYMTRSDSPDELEKLMEKIASISAPLVEMH